jgi:large subunit ribosomal protein L4
MAAVTVKTTTGGDAGAVDLDAEIFGIQPNVPVMHQVVTAQLAARRSGTQSTKTRAEVRGGGRKPFKQKGTGNARQGSTRSPQFSGGGVALGPKPRSYAQKTPKKMIRLALRSALSDRAAEGKIVVVEEWSFAAPKTRDAVAALGALGIDGRVLVVVDVDGTNTIKSFLNLPEVQLIERGELNAYDVLCNDWIVFTKSTLPTGSGSSIEMSAAESDIAEAVEVAESAAAAERGASDEIAIEPEFAESAAGGEGSASDEPHAARGGSEADDEPAIDTGSASDEIVSDTDQFAESPAGGEGRASDEPQSDEENRRADEEDHR